MLITAALSQGATAVIFGGADHRSPIDLALVERHPITVMGCSPHCRRALMPHGPEHCTPTTSSSLRMWARPASRGIRSPYRWLFENAGKARIPISNYTGGTEISGGILGCFPIARSSRARSRARFPAWPRGLR